MERHFPDTELPRKAQQLWATGDAAFAQLCTGLVRIGALDGTEPAPEEPKVYQ